ncbi:phage late control D family protein [Microvirga alba]|nr:contractile injection system protein, VgrG/Pvc8 family [Microvirga alba]
MENIKPEYRVLANQADITAMVAERLVSMRFTDEAGLESDILEIVLADHDPMAPIQVPPTGAELELFLGYDGLAQRMGLFVCDEVEIAGWPGEMTIRARAAPFDQSKGGKSHLQTQKTRSWPKDTKLGDMAKKIAKEHGMEAAVAKSLASIKLPHIDQADESDLHFLARVAKKYDAIVKPAGGKLVLAKKGETKSVSGEQLPTVTLAPGEVSRFRVVQSKRETAGMVVAYWHATKQAKRHEVKVGQGEPVTRLKMYYPTKEMALAAARSELDRRERRKVTASLQLPGRTDLVAEGKVILAGFRDGVDGEWIATRVEHGLDGNGYSCNIELEKPNSDGTKATEETEE